MPEKKPGWRGEDLEGEFMLYSEAQTRAVYLNESAALVWRLIDGTRPVDEIVGLLVEAYGVSPQRMREDVKAALQELLRHDVICWRRDD